MAFLRRRDGGDGEGQPPQSAQPPAEQPPAEQPTEVQEPTQEERSYEPQEAQAAMFEHLRASRERWINPSDSTPDSLS